MIEAAKAADPGVSWWPYAEALDPNWALTQLSGVVSPMQALWINHHDGLHSRWLPEHIEQFKARGVKVLLTYHDTRERLEDCPKLDALLQVVDRAIIHEPMDVIGMELGKKVIYLRQGILDPQSPTLLARLPPMTPLLGTVGFDFPWKNYNRLAELTAEIGWGLLILSNNITDTRARELTTINPYLTIHSGFQPAERIVERLAACTATAFMYECANTGTSGAIRLGIAARKPVFALGSCRQFRDLILAEKDSDDGQLINWVYTWDTLKRLLIQSWPVDCDPAMVYLAERDSMAKVGQRYVEILRSL